MKPPYIFILFFLLSSYLSMGQIQVDNSTAPEDIVALLVGDGISYSNVLFSGDLNQFGSFFDNNSNIGISSGVILGTGDIELAEGPNNDGGSTMGGGDFSASDPDLETISGVDIHDVAILEFDFVPTGDIITFHYVFGSEEYNEFVCGMVNDAFGFFLSGPGINGAFSSPTGFPNGSVNIALIPGGEIGVSIGTVNNGQFGVNGQPSNCFDLDPNWQSNTAYFQDNANADFIQYDGMTVVMEATHGVVCGETYHIKLAIGDGGDTVFDSGVFLEENSFSSNVPTAIELNIVQATNVDNGVYENCGGAVLEFTRNVNFDQEISVYLLYSGNAQNGIDYNLPDSITFYPNDTTILLLFNPFLDGITENIENIIISISFTDACLNIQVVDLIELFIVDVTPMSLITDDINICGEDMVNLSPVVANGIPPYSYLWSNGETSSNIDVATDNVLQYTVVVSDICQQTDSLIGEINILIPEPPTITFPPAIVTYTCEDTIPILCQITGDYVSVSFTTFQGEVIGESNPMTYDTSVQTNSITAEVIDQCDMSSTVIIPIVQEDPPALILELSDDIIDASCLDLNTVTAVVSGGEQPYDYNWSIDDEIVNENLTYSFLTFETTSVTFNVKDNCDQLVSQEVMVSILSPPINMTLTEGMLVCEHEDVTLHVEASGGDGDFSYLWSDFGYGQTFSFLANSSKNYPVTITDACGQSISGSVQVDVIDFNVEYEISNLGENSYYFEGFTFPHCNDDCSYLWSFGDNTTSNNISTYHTYEGFSSHVGYLSVTDIHGCSDSSYFTILPPFNLFVPSSFTPDNDGVNDVFQVFGVGVRDYNIKIYNRWGEIVYQSFDINEVWIGEVSTKNYYTGNEVYNWVIKAQGYDAHVHIRRGTLTVIR